MIQLTKEQWAIFAAHRYIAQRVADRPQFAPWRHRRDELVVAAEDGIIRSFKSWHPECGASFKTSAYKYAHWAVRMHVRDVFRREPPTSSAPLSDDHAAAGPEGIADVATNWAAVTQELAEAIHQRTHLRMVRALRNARIFVRVKFHGAALEDVAAEYRINRKAAKTVVQRTEVDFNNWKAKARGTSWARAQRTELSSQLAA